MNKRPLQWTLLAAAIGLSCSVSAHRMWMLPSATNVSGDDAWVTVDAALSNDLFHPDHVPANLAQLVITAPDGQAAKPEHAVTGKYRSVFDVHLVQEGTYKLALAMHGLSASYELDGERKRWRGNAAGLAQGVPANARNVVVTESVNRIETFVSNGKPNDRALASTGRGLELVPVTHVTDLSTGEPATFQLLLDGKPAAGIKVTAIAGAARYRNTPDEITANTGSDGRFTLAWPHAGMYWVNASAEDGKSSVTQATRRRLAYSATFEVLPE